MNPQTPATTSRSADRIKQLTAAGQSVWIDFIKRSMLGDGTLQKMIDEGLRGMTSNPSIFEKAITSSTDYATDLAAAGAESAKNPRGVFERLALADISSSALRSPTSAPRAIACGRSTTRRASSTATSATRSRPTSRWIAPRRWTRCAASGRRSIART
jgi:hypothetical protein